MPSKITNKDLAIKLATTEKEDEVIKLLKDLGYWDNSKYWRPFGDNENNISTMGNQQSEPDKALVEKLINSVDAIFMKECLLRRIDMEGPKAPQSMNAALKEFFGISEGQISRLDTATRNKMSENIILAATGSATHLCLTLVDQGEGQTPKRMPETILSISKSNKLCIPFVQGKFNMGGTGVLRFCGDRKLQLVISKRCPDIINYDNDETFDKWSVTVVRKEPPTGNRRTSLYTYLTDKNGNILTFTADSLPIIPNRISDAKDMSYEKMEYGTYFKLYDYNIRGYKTNILFDLNYRLSTLIPELAHPIRLRECRQHYTGHSFGTTLSGLHTRLSDDRSENIEEGFPTSNVFNIDGQNIRCQIYVFKKSRSGNYRKKEGILYVVNGQTHAAVNDTAFAKANLSYLADSILVLVDCSDLDVIHQDDMFMSSRDRFGSSKFVTKIKDQVNDILKEHPGLRKLQNERKEAAVHNCLKDDKPLQDVLQNILKKSPVLSNILLHGNRVSDPFKTKPAPESSKKFVGKKHPTYFKIKGKATNESVTKKVPINKNFRIQFETDVQNDYFTRPDERGSLELYMDNIRHPDLKKHLGLFNGIATLTVLIPEDMKIGEQHKYRVEIVDDCIPYTLKNEFLAIGTAEENNAEGNKKRKKDPTNGEQSGGAEMPTMTDVYKDDINWRELQMDDDSALVVRLNEGERDNYFINMDNRYILTELKSIKEENKLELTRARYRYSITLIGMSIESYFKTNAQENDKIDVSSEISKISSMIVPILIPMLDAMSILDIEDIIKE